MGNDIEPSKPSASHLEAAGRSLVRVLRNPDIRALELSWTIGVGVDWAILVVALVVAYDAGGAFLVALVTLTRLLPATLVNIAVDTGAWRRPERGLVGVHLVRAAGAAAVAAAGPRGAAAARVHRGRRRVGRRRPRPAHHADAPAGRRGPARRTS